MPDCECLSRCPFFNDKMKSKPGSAALLKKRLCQGDNSDCARHIVLCALGREAVPADLWPNAVDRAAEILAKQR